MAYFDWFSFSCLSPSLSTMGETQLHGFVLLNFFVSSPRSLNFPLLVEFFFFGLVLASDACFFPPPFLTRPFRFECIR
jgi:hypothetical protein